MSYNIIIIDNSVISVILELLLIFCEVHIRMECNVNFPLNSCSNMQWHMLHI